MSATHPVQKNGSVEALISRFGGIEFSMPMPKTEFIHLAEKYPDMPMEREADGTVTIMSPVKKGTGRREFNLSGIFFMWHYRTGLGEFFSPSTGFDLPSGATKSPDLAWISPEKLAAGLDSDDEKFVQIVPDFVVEVRSGTDRPAKLKSKMTDVWMANGVRLAWLIDPYLEQVLIYRAGQTEPEMVAGFAENLLSGEDVLPDFEFPLKMMLRV